MQHFFKSATLGMNNNNKQKYGLFNMPIQNKIGNVNPNAQNKQMQFVNQQLTNEINSREQVCNIILINYISLYYNVIYK